MRFTCFFKQVQHNIYGQTSKNECSETAQLKLESTFRGNLSIKTKNDQLLLPESAVVIPHERQQIGPWRRACCGCSGSLRERTGRLCKAYSSHLDHSFQRSAPPVAAECETANASFACSAEKACTGMCLLAGQKRECCESTFIKPYCDKSLEPVSQLYGRLITFPNRQGPAAQSNNRNWSEVLHSSACQSPFPGTMESMFHLMENDVDHKITFLKIIHFSLLL